MESGNSEGIWWNCGERPGLEISGQEKNRGCEAESGGKLEGQVSLGYPL